MTSPFTFTVTAADAQLDQVLHGGQVTRGRTDPSQQCRAGYARVAYLDLDGASPRVPLVAAVTVEVTVEGAAVPTARQVFTGWVSDRGDGIIRQGSVARATQRTITAVGDLGLAPRRPVRDGGYPAQLDGERVRAALFDAFARSWLLATRTWSQVPGTVTWLTYDPQLAASDVPDGAFDLAADTDATDPYVVLRKAAQDAGAVLFESGDGGLFYQQATDRGVAFALDGPVLTLPAPLANGLTSSVKLADQATDVAVGYVGGLAEASDLDTAKALGRVIEWTVSTSLTDSTQAQARADQILDYRRNPRPVLQLSYQLAALDPDVADQLLALELGDLVALPDLGTVDADGQGFVEQLQLTIDRNAPTLTLTLSSPAATLAYLAWVSMPGQWQDTVGTWSTV